MTRNKIPSKIPAKLKDLYEAALASRDHAHAPYSKFKVGAALKTRKGKIYSGCNVENASFGGTVCAERGAIQTAVAAEGKLNIKEILVLTDSTPPWPPCALCRQIISEFAKDIDIHAVNLKGQLKTYRFSELYPDAFTPSELK